jgi:hypothetical protein
LGNPLTHKPAIVPAHAEECSRGVWQWTVPGALVILPFLSADPLKDDDEWLEAQMEGMPRLDGEREYLVSFDVHEGKPVFGEFREHLHVSRKPLPYVPNRIIVRGHDIPGPLACVWAQLYPMPAKRPGEIASQPMRLHVLAELYCDSGLSEYGRQVNQQTKLLFPEATQFMDWADPAAWAESQVNDKRSAAALMNADHNIRLSPGPANIVDRVEPVRKWLQRMIPTDAPTDPMGAILIDPSCVILREAFKGGYHYREVEKSGRYREIPDKNEYSHIMDALCYAVARINEATLRRETLKPLKFPEGGIRGYLPPGGYDPARQREERREDRWKDRARE